jgi:hypothetical protein
MMLKIGKTMEQWQVQLIYITQTEDFQRKMYSDKNIDISILFYESTLKSLHEFEGL